MRSHVAMRRRSSRRRDAHSGVRYYRRYAGCGETRRGRELQGDVRHRDENARRRLALAVTGPALALGDLRRRNEALGLLRVDARSCLEDDIMTLEGSADHMRTLARELRDLARRVLAIFGADGSRQPAWAGVAVASSLSRSRSARARAHTALRLGKTLWPRGMVILYEDVWILDVLSNESGSLRELALLLDPLVEHDASNGTELLRTLEALFEADLSQTRAAHRLRAHRHTIAQRLTLTESVLGRSVRRSPERLLLEIAVKARRLIAAGEPAGELPPTRGSVDPPE